MRIAFLYFSVLVLGFSYTFANEDGPIHQEIGYAQVPLVAGKKVYFFDPLVGIGVADIDVYGALISEPKTLIESKLLGIPDYVTPKKRPDGPRKNIAVKPPWSINYPNIFKPMDYGVQDSWYASISNAFHDDSSGSSAVLTANDIIIINTKGEPRIAKNLIDDSILGPNRDKKVTFVSHANLNGPDLSFLMLNEKVHLFFGEKSYILPAQVTLQVIGKVYSDGSDSTDWRALLRDIQNGIIKYDAGGMFNKKLQLETLEARSLDPIEPLTKDWTIKAKFSGAELTSSTNTFLLTALGGPKELATMQSETATLGSDGKIAKWKPFAISNFKTRGTLGDFWSYNQQRFTMDNSDVAFLFDANRGIAIQSGNGRIEHLVDDPILLFPQDGKSHQIDMREFQAHSQTGVFKSSYSMDQKIENWQMNIVVGDKYIYVIDRTGSVFNLGARPRKNPHVISLKEEIKRRVESKYNIDVKRFKFGVNNEISIPAIYGDDNVKIEISKFEKNINGRRILFFGIPGEFAVIFDSTGKGTILENLHPMYFNKLGEGYVEFKIEEIRRSLDEGRFFLTDEKYHSFQDLLRDTPKLAPLNNQWKLFDNGPGAILLPSKKGSASNGPNQSAKPTVNPSTVDEVEVRKKSGSHGSAWQQFENRPQERYKESNLGAFSFERTNKSHLVEVTPAQTEEFKKHFSIMNKELIAMPPLELESREVTDVRRALLDDEIGSAVILGESGSGKSKLALGILAQIARGEIPSISKETPIVRVNSGMFSTETSYAGQSSQRVTALINWAVAHDAILFMDEIHTMRGDGTSKDNSIDNFNRLKTALSDYGLRIIGTTTDNEWARYFAGDEALARRFKRIHKENIPVEKVAGYLAKKNESMQRPQFNSKVLDYIIDLAQIYAAEGTSISKAGLLMESVYALCKDKRIHPSQITSVEIVEAASSLYNLKPERFDSNETRRKLRELSTKLDVEIIGHKELKTQLADDMKRGLFASLNNPRPNGLRLVTGPEGVGKSTVLEATAKFLGVNYKRLNMGQYATEYDAERLLQDIGKELLKDPFSVIFLDEIEKANPKVQTALLDFLDSPKAHIRLSLNGSGSDSDAVTRTISTNKSFIYGATNAGRDFLKTHPTFQEDELREAMIRDGFNRYLNNRFTKITVLHPPTEAELRQIVARKLFKSIRSAENGNPRLKQALLNIGFEGTSGSIIPDGARELVDKLTTAFNGLNGSGRRATDKVEEIVDSRIIDLIFEIEDGHAKFKYIQNKRNSQCYHFYANTPRRAVLNLK